MKFCIGYTGIEKTTSIQHCLKLGAGTVTELETKSLRSPSQYMVVFPTFLDGALRLDGDNFDFAGRIASICAPLEKLYSIKDRTGSFSYDLLVYDVSEQFDNGSFGAVYKYHHNLLDMDFAIKLFEPILFPIWKVLLGLMGKYFYLVRRSQCEVSSSMDMVANGTR